MSKRRGLLITGFTIATASFLASVAYAGGAWSATYPKGPLMILACGATSSSSIDCNGFNGVCVSGSSWCTQGCFDAAMQPLPPSPNPLAYVRCKGGSTNGVW